MYINVDAMQLKFNIKESKCSIRESNCYISELRIRCSKISVLITACTCLLEFTSFLHTDDRLNPAYKQCVISVSHLLGHSAIFSHFTYIVIVLVRPMLYILLIVVAGIIALCKLKCSFHFSFDFRVIIVI
jgi:hypothetical protein